MTRAFLMILVSAAISPFLSTNALAAARSERWMTSYDEAVAKAFDQGRVLMINFTRSDANDDSQHLKKQVFRTDEFKDWADDNLVLLRVDFPKEKEQSKALKKQNKALAEKFSVDTFPTNVFLRVTGRPDEDGEANVEEIGRLDFEKGGPSEWIESAQKLMRAKPPESTTERSWIEDFEEARRLAKAENKMILADFTGSDWCKWCIVLDEEVFETEEFTAWANDNVILLKLDFPRRSRQSAEIREQNAELARKYGIKGYPTILFLDDSGEKLGQMGYMPGGPAPWIRQADAIVDAKKPRNRADD